MVEHASQSKIPDSVLAPNKIKKQITAQHRQLWATTRRSPAGVPAARRICEQGCVCSGDTAASEGPLQGGSQRAHSYR